MQKKWKIVIRPKNWKWSKFWFFIARLMYLNCLSRYQKNFWGYQLGFRNLLNFDWNQLKHYELTRPSSCYCKCLLSACNTFTLPNTWGEVELWRERNHYTLPFSCFMLYFRHLKRTRSALLAYQQYSWFLESNNICY